MCSRASIHAGAALAEEHPDWFARDRAGGLSVNNFTSRARTPAITATAWPKWCAVLTHDVDGIWNNHGKFAAWDRRLLLRHMQNAVQERQRLDLPLTENWDDPAWRAFNEWRYRRIAAWPAHTRKFIVRSRPPFHAVGAVDGVA
jgi:hypothetical protein